MSCVLRDIQAKSGMVGNYDTCICKLCNNTMQVLYMCMVTAMTITWNNVFSSLPLDGSADTGLLIHYNNWITGKRCKTH